MDRACTICGKTRKDKHRRSYCSTCNGRLQRERHYVVVRRVKESNPCALCGESDPVVLQFHHVDPTTTWKHPKAAWDKRYRMQKGVTGLISASKNPQMVREEIEKCVMLCANCHLKVEAGRASVEGLPLLKVEGG